MITFKKSCKDCGENKPMTDFVRSLLTADKFTNQCKPCRQARRQETGEGRKNILRDYGLTIEEFDVMSKEQGESCKICGLSSEEVLNVDHCHSTNKVRGLLCRKCNTGLGQFNDNIETLKIAIKYLEEK